ncbi:MAG: efflux RND transporter periplasmic adaptor subunit [Planctomycetales bacterium]|nr:efflux RND transporter periplasmic adaptor subunit [Planctomycetales bacterium]
MCTTLKSTVISLLCCATAHAVEFESFTEPLHTIEAAVGEPGRVFEVRVRRGDTVEPGDLLLALDTGVLETSRRAAQARAESDAELKSLEVELRLRQERLEKLRALQQTGAGSAEEVRRAEADRDVEQLRVEHAKAELQQLRIEVDEMDARLEQRRVRSPIRGLVTEVRHEVGEYVSALEPHVATIVDLSQLRATFYLPLDAAQEFNSGQDVEVRLPEFDRNVVGAVEHVGAVTRADSGLVRVDILLNNEHATLRSGVRVRLAAPNHAD